MFGLDCRVLRKQFGKLFLTSRHSEAPQGANGSCGLIKRAAMFGLDARIALAIFGALSVISGAALYSAIQQSKVTAVITEMGEVGKAYDGYYLDTGSELPIISDGVYIDIQKLVDSTVTNWSGPYISYPKHSSIAYGLEHPLYGAIYIGEMLNGTWASNTGSPGWKDSTNCSTGTVGGTCDIWVVFQDVSTDLYNALDNEIDGAVNGQTGNLRLVQVGAGTRHVYLKYRPKQS